MRHFSKIKKLLVGEGSKRNEKEEAGDRRELKPFTAEAIGGWETNVIFTESWGEIIVFIEKVR